MTEKKGAAKVTLVSSGGVQVTVLSEGDIFLEGLMTVQDGCLVIRHEGLTTNIFAAGHWISAKGTRR